MKINTDSKKIEEILERWVDKIYPSKEEFLKALQTKKLVIYHGADPTAPQLHLGHSTNFLLLKKFQELGHKIILLIGDFTARIGDPTGRLSARKALSEQEVKQNLKTYRQQIGKILDFTGKNKAEIRFNSRWLAKMNLEKIIELAGHFTIGQIIKRNMFQERIKKDQEIYFNEFFYPLLQGYDSVVMDVDTEVGGTDQTFNMLVGRDLMKVYKKKEKFVLTTFLLENSKTGKKLMSKSEGNFIALNDQANEMYGKVMALPDEVIVPCLRFCTEVSLTEIKKIEENLKSQQINPRDLKARLAREIVNIYYGEIAARKAEKEFEEIFKKGQMPSEMPEIKIRDKNLPILDLLVKAKIASSKSEAKRLVEQKGVKIDNQISGDWTKIIGIKNGMVLQAGKRRFVKIII